MQDAADESVADHVYPTDQAIGGLAMVEPRTGDVKALAQSRPDGPRPQEGRDLPQLRRPEAVRRLRRLPGRVDVQGVRARRGDREGHPARHQDQRAAEDLDPDVRVPDLRRPQLLQHRRLGARELHRQRHLRPLHRHPAVGEHLLRPAGEADRPVRALPAGPRDGHRPDRPQPRAGAVVHPGRRRDQPARDGRGLRHLRRPRPALQPRAGDLHRGRRRQRAQGVPRELPPGDGRLDGRRGQRHPARRPGARRLRLRQRPRPQPAVRRQDRHDPGQHGRLVHGLHAEPRHRRDDRRRQRRRHTGSP